MSQGIRMMRKIGPVTAAGAAIALALIGAGSAQAGPQPSPPPTPQYPVPTWLTSDARQELAEAIQQAAQEFARDPEHASEWPLAPKRDGGPLISCLRHRDRNRSGGGEVLVQLSQYGNCKRTP